MIAPPSPLSPGLWAGRAVGLLGGSFNPAHEGHVHLSLHALKALNLDAVWWMVSPGNPLKPARGMAPLARRLASARQIARDPHIAVTDIESQLGTVYTADTLAALTARMPQTRFVWLMGMDNLHQIHLWRDWERIFTTVRVCVVDRERTGGRLVSCRALERFRPALVRTEKAGTLTSLPPPAWTILRAPLHPASSTALRQKNGWL